MKRMQRMQSRKSHSWWWDSHVSPKNSKWLAENLEEMDKQVKEMLKLIEEEGDSFAKKAEMYYQRRPLLISHVENFYRMYRALAERYDNVTGELRKNIPSALRSQGSYGLSESDSETQSPSPSPEPDLDQKTPVQKHKTRAAGFDVFLGSGGSSDISKKGSDGSSSSSESDSELDEAKEENGNGIAYTLNQRILELEDELREAKEKLEVLEEKNMQCQCDSGVNGSCSTLGSKISGLEAELASTREKLQASEAENSNLKNSLEQKTRSESFSEVDSKKAALEAEVLKNKNEIEHLKGAMASARKKYEADLANCDLEIEKYKQELCHSSEKYSQDKSTLEAGIQKLQEVIKNFEGQLATISQEKLLLESRVKGLEQAANNLSDSAAEIMRLEEIIRNMQLDLEKVSHEKSLLEERVAEFEQVATELKASSMEVPILQDAIKSLKAQLESVSHEKLQLEDRVEELEQVASDLKASAESSSEKFLLEKSCLSAEILRLSETNASLEAKLTSMDSQLKQINAAKEAASLESEKNISELNQNLASLNLKLEILASENAALDDKASALANDVITRDDKIRQMDSHLNQLHLEHMKLIMETDAAQRAMTELRARVRELEEEVEKQKEVISDSAEGKREAIRQLCFSLEHYRDGYRQLRRMLQGHRRPMVMAT